jgi:hypothetical protein
MTILITLAIIIVALGAVEIATQIQESRNVHPDPRD